MGFKTIITEWITKRTTRNQVIDGPFKGMAYPGKSVGSAYCPKLIGTYEKELFPVIASWNDHQPEVILNVGGAEGYYAVGLARVHPQCKVIVWEAVHKGRQLISAMSRLNNVSTQIEIRGFCSHENLIEEVEKYAKCTIIMDVEGAEGELLNQKSQSFDNVEILVEIHDEIIKGVGKNIMDRFSQSHQITKIEPQKRSREDFDSTLLYRWRFLPEFVLDKMLDEKRGYNYWLHCRPLPSPNFIEV
jgi:hypothetical protein